MMTDERKNKKRLVVGLAKFGLTAVVIAGIAFGFVAFDTPTGDVAEAEADVWSVFTRDVSSHEKFMKVLEQEGMQPPRQYDYNGNQVFFSYDTTRESPRAVMIRYQEAFVREGVNAHFHPGVRNPSTPEEMDLDTPGGQHAMTQAFVGVDDMFTGGMVPVENTRNSVRMVGFQTKGDAGDVAQLLQESESGRRSPDEFIGAIRYMDATREEGSLETTITAVWSDEYLDMEKFRPNTRSTDTVHPIEYEIPACTGCSRVARLSGTEHEADMHNLLYRSRSGVQEVVSFYDRHMGSYGWELEPAMRGLNRLQENGYATEDAAQIRAYIKNGMHLTVVVYPDFETGHTYVKMMTNR